MQSLYPETLQAARLARGFSLAALSNACGISAPTLSRLESGTRNASDEEISSLSTALNIPETALRRPLVSERLGLSAFYHRKLSRAGVRAVSTIENQCLIDVVALRELVGMIDVECPEHVPNIELDDVKNGDVEEAANMLRLAWRIPRGPITDLFLVVERAGCFVIHSDFGVSEVDALYHKVIGMHPIFWVNSRKPLDRVRWSVAHELGHLILHDTDPIENKLAEDQANLFASAFLMPKQDFRSECPSRLGIPELIELKRRWRCSMQAIIRRAFNIGKITERQYQNLMITISRRGWKKREPYPISSESPALLANIINSCQRQIQISDEELASRIAVTANKLRSWKQPFPGQRPDANDDRPVLRYVAG